MQHLILDTNVVIDWLVFSHPDTALLRECVVEGSVIVLTHPALCAELERVLSYRTLKLDEARRAQVLTSYRERTVAAAVDAVELPPDFPRCRDPDDQMFLELAYRTRCDGLVTRDKLVLKMRKRLRKLGVTILDVRGMDEQLASRRSGDDEFR